MSRGVLNYPAFVRFWLADAVAALGSFTLTLALQFLLIETLQADQGDLGLIRSAQWLPYLCFGLLAGALVDRMRRKPLLVAGHAASAALLGAVAALAFTEALTVPMLALLVAGVGTAAIFLAAAHQSLLPRLVPTALLPTANARIEQTLTAAQAAGPLVAGSVVRFLSAPVAIAGTALTHALAAAVFSTIKVTEGVPERAPARALGAELREGARWVYRHRTLAPYAIGLHTWFVANAAIMTIFVFHASQDLGFDPLTVGAVLACAGLSGVIGAGLSPWAARTIGLGQAVSIGYWLSPLGWALVLLAGHGGTGLILLVAAQLVAGLGQGLQGPLEMSYRNAVTPDRLRGRMNATIRSFNWGSIALSAPLAGFAATAWGNLPVLGFGVAAMVLAALIVTCSPFRTADMPADEPAGAEN